MIIFTCRASLIRISRCLLTEPAVSHSVLHSINLEPVLSLVVLHHALRHAVPLSLHCDGCAAASSVKLNTREDVVRASYNQIIDETQL